MPSTLNSYWLSAVMLAALVLCAPGTPVRDAPTESPAGELSGEEDVGTSDRLSDSPVWESILGATKRHEMEFEDEFKNNVKYNFLDHYKTSPRPADCRFSNFSKEDCLRRLVHGLQTYKVLLKYVEKEYPESSILSEAKYLTTLLINLIKRKMRHPEQVSALKSSEKQELLRELDNPDPFKRKMKAHSILRQFHYFLRDGQLAVRRREMFRGIMATRNMAY